MGRIEERKKKDFLNFNEMFYLLVSIPKHWLCYKFLLCFFFFPLFVLLWWYLYWDIYSAFVMLVHVVASSFFWNFFHVACNIQCFSSHWTELSNWTHFFFCSDDDGVVGPLNVCACVRVRVQLNVVALTSIDSSRWIEPQLSTGSLIQIIHWICISNTNQICIICRKNYFLLTFFHLNKNPKTI